MRIRLCPWQGLELVLPPGASEREGRAFVAARSQWIEQAWSQLRERVPQAFDAAVPERITLRLLDEEWKLTCDPDAARRSTRGQSLRVPVSPDDLDGFRQEIKPWLRARASEDLPERVGHVSRETGLKYRRVQIRDQRTRWGSCSSRGTISLNLRVLFHRPEVVDYLILHELCHTRHMNHGPRFKALLARFQPDWRALDRELVREGGGVPGWLGW